MEEVVNAPLEEVGEDEEEQELCEKGPPGHRRPFEPETQGMKAPRGGNRDGARQGGCQKGEKMPVEREKAHIAEPPRTQERLGRAPREEAFE
jgi:hypothetical protein